MKFFVWERQKMLEGEEFCAQLESSLNELVS